MPDRSGMAGSPHLLSAAFTRLVRLLVFACLVVSSAGVLAMMGVTCLDVVLRIFGRPLVGAFDIVELAGAITVAGAMPYTTAVKGHVAIEYFFHKLPRTGRVVADTVLRLASMALFGLICWRSVEYGLQLRRTGEVTATLQVPVFWVAHAVALSCGIVVLVTSHNLIHPGKETVKA